MKLNALLLYFGLVGSLCSLCQESRADCNTSPTVPTVVPLGPGFDAANYGDCSVKGDTCDNPPTVGTVGTGSRQVPAMPPTAMSDIQAAFNIAPSFFKTELCNLDRIYIDTILNSNNPFARGIRERLYPADPTLPRRKEIGISAQVWSTLASATHPPYASYENWLFTALLSPLPPGAATSWANAFTYQAVPDPASPSSTPSNPNAVAALAIIAHEMGHIIWFDKSAGTMTRCTKASRPQFSLYSWPGSGVVHGFRRLGQQDNNNHTNDGPDIAKISSDLRFNSPPNSGLYPAAVSDLRAVFGSGNWASLFATVSLDEDFVETFKLWVLTDSGDPIIALHVNIPTLNPIDILARVNNPRTKLYAKTQWIQRCLTWP